MVSLVTAHVGSISQMTVPAWWFYCCFRRLFDSLALSAFRVMWGGCTSHRSPLAFYSSVAIFWTVCYGGCCCGCASRPHMHLISANETSSEELFLALFWKKKKGSDGERKGGGGDGMGVCHKYAAYTLINTHQLNKACGLLRPRHSNDKDHAGYSQDLTSPLSWIRLGSLPVKH